MVRLKSVCIVINRYFETIISIKLLIKKVVGIVKTSYNIKAGFVVVGIFLSFLVCFSFIILLFYIILSEIFGIH